MLVTLCVAAAAIPLRAQPRAHPDLQGLWVNGTATPLERPASVGGKEFFTPDEAAAYEKQYQLDRTLAISRDKDFELSAAGDLDTYEPGHLLPGGRTSLIVDPPDGRVPALTPEARRLFTERTQHLDQTSLRGTSTALHVVERFTLSSPGAITYRFTIDDPAFVRSWTGESRLTRTSDRLYEYACHEANYSMGGILSGARFSEKK